MIVINYLKPNIVIYADSLITGEVVLFDENNKRFLLQKIRNQSIITIPLKIKKNKNIKVTLKTKEQTLTKNLCID